MRPIGQLSNPRQYVSRYHPYGHPWQLHGPECPELPPDRIATREEVDERADVQQCMPASPPAKKPHA